MQSLRFTRDAIDEHLRHLVEDICRVIGAEDRATGQSLPNQSGDHG